MIGSNNEVKAKLLIYHRKNFYPSVYHNAYYDKLADAP